jgi:hypothetical protein
LLFGLRVERFDRIAGARPVFTAQGIAHAAGPKLRKWYGETDKLLLPKDGQGGNDEEGDDDDAGPREAIVVVGADSELGQLTVMQLVLAR